MKCIMLIIFMGLFVGCGAVKVAEREYSKKELAKALVDAQGKQEREDLNVLEELKIEDVLKVLKENMEEEKYIPKNIHPANLVRALQMTYGISGSKPEKELRKNESKVMRKYNQAIERAYLFGYLRIALVDTKPPKKRKGISFDIEEIQKDSALG